MNPVLKSLLTSRVLIFSVIFLILGMVCIYLYVQWDLARFEADLPSPPAERTSDAPIGADAPPVKPPVSQTDALEKGTAAQPAALSQHKPPPGAVTTPVFPTPEKAEDPVTTAYKRLEYIQNNPYAWGGVFSPRATALIEELMPPPVLRDEDHGEEVDALISELIAQGDPRAANVLIANICDGYIAGRHMSNAIVAIGPPSVPALLPYVREGRRPWTGTVIRCLGEIALQHRGDLGGIVDYILIPKFTHVAADEKYEKFDPFAVKAAREWLDKVK